MKCSQCDLGLIRATGCVNLKKNELLLICDGCLSLFTVDIKYLNNGVCAKVKYRDKLTKNSKQELAVAEKSFLQQYQLDARKYWTLEKYVQQIQSCR